MSADHIIADAKTGKFACEFCGAQEEPPFMPAPINVIIDAMDHFISQHEGCKRPAPETVISLSFSVLPDCAVLLCQCM